MKAERFEAQIVVPLTLFSRHVIMATHDYTHMKKLNARVVRCEEGRLLELSAAGAV